MKRVLYNVAKAIKEAGYPQKYLDFGYSTKEQTLDGVVFKEGSIIDLDAFDPRLDDFVYAPTYIEIWLWLWREKGICIEIKDNHYHITAKVKNQRFHGDNQEEVIEAAINYLVENNLIK